MRPSGLIVHSPSLLKLIPAIGRAIQRAVFRQLIIVIEIISLIFRTFKRWISRDRHILSQNGSPVTQLMTDTGDIVISFGDKVKQ
jgi:hypothetical protein